MERKSGSSKGHGLGGGKVGGATDDAGGKKSNKKHVNEHEQNKNEPQHQRDNVAADGGRQAQSSRPVSSTSGSSSVAAAGSFDKNNSKKKGSGRADTTTAKDSNTKGSKQDTPKEKTGGGNTTCERADARPAGFIELKPFQRLPKELLHNYCQKHKLPRPHYELRRARRPNYFRSECILTPSTKDASQKKRFLTEQDWEFKNHSEQFSALLALHELEPTRPYEKLFPSPFREAWLALSSPPVPSSAPPSSNQRGSHRTGRAAPPTPPATTTTPAVSNRVLSSNAATTTTTTTRDTTVAAVESSSCAVKTVDVLETPRSLEADSSASICASSSRLAVQRSHLKQQQVAEAIDNRIVNGSTDAATAGKSSFGVRDGNNKSSLSTQRCPITEEETTSTASLLSGEITSTSEQVITPATGTEVTASTTEKARVGTTAGPCTRMTSGRQKLFNRKHADKKEGKSAPAAKPAAAVASTGAVPSAPVFAISNAHRYVSEYQRKQEEEQKRCELVRRQKAREQALREQQESRPEVFMAAAVRAAVRTFLFKALRRAALMGPVPPDNSLSCTGQGGSGPYVPSLLCTKNSTALLSTRKTTADYPLKTASAENKAVLSHFPDVRPLEWSCSRWLRKVLLLFPQFCKKKADSSSRARPTADASTPPHHSLETAMGLELLEKQTVKCSTGQRVAESFNEVGEVLDTKRQPKTNVETLLVQALQKREGFTAFQAEASMSALLRVLELFIRYQTSKKTNRREACRSNQGHRIHYSRTDSVIGAMASHGGAETYNRGIYSSSRDIHASSESQCNRLEDQTAGPTRKDWYVQEGDSSSNSSSDSEDCTADAVALANPLAWRARKPAACGAAVKCMDRSEKEELLRNVFQSCIDWICLNESDESKLPEAYSPLGKQIEVHVFSSPQNTASEAAHQQQQEREKEAEYREETSGEAMYSNGTTMAGGGMTAAGGGMICHNTNERNLFVGMKGTSMSEAMHGPASQVSQDRGHLTHRGGEAVAPPRVIPSEEGIRGVLTSDVTVRGASQRLPQKGFACGTKMQTCDAATFSAFDKRERHYEPDPPDTPLVAAQCRHGDSHAIIEALCDAGVLLVVGYPAHAKHSAGQARAAEALAGDMSAADVQWPAEQTAAATKWEETIRAAAINFLEKMAATFSQSRAGVTGISGASDAHTRSPQIPVVESTSTEAGLEAFRSFCTTTWLYGEGSELLETGTRYESLVSILIEQGRKALLYDEVAAVPTDTKRQQHSVGGTEEWKAVYVDNHEQRQAGAAGEKEEIRNNLSIDYDHHRGGPTQPPQKRFFEADELVVAPKDIHSISTVVPVCSRAADRWEKEGDRGAMQQIEKHGRTPNGSASHQNTFVDSHAPFSTVKPCSGNTDSSYSLKLAARLEELLQTEQQVIESTMPAASFVLLPASPPGAMQKHQPPRQQPLHQQQSHQQQPPQHQQSHRQQPPHQQQSQQQQLHQQHSQHVMNGSISSSSSSSHSPGVFGHARLEAVDIAPLLSFFSFHCTPLQADSKDSPTSGTYRQQLQQPQFFLPLHVFMYASAGALYPLNPPTVWISFDLPAHMSQQVLQRSQQQHQFSQQQQRQNSGDRDPCHLLDNITFYGAALAFLSLCVSLGLSHFLASRLDRAYRSCRAIASQRDSRCHVPASFVPSHGNPKKVDGVFDADKDPLTSSLAAGEKFVSSSLNQSEKQNELTAGLGLGRKESLTHEEIRCASTGAPVQDVADSVSSLPSVVSQGEDLFALLEELETTGVGTSTFSEVVALLQSPAQLVATLSAAFSKYLLPASQSDSRAATAALGTALTDGVTATYTASPRESSDRLLSSSRAPVELAASSESAESDPDKRASAEVFPKTSRLQQKLQMRRRQGISVAHISSPRETDGGTVTSKSSPLLASSEHTGQRTPGLPTSGRDQIIKHWCTLLRLPSASYPQDELDRAKPQTQAPRNSTGGEKKEDQQPMVDIDERRRRGLQQKQPAYVNKEPHYESTERSSDATTTTTTTQPRSYALTKQICEKILRSRHSWTASPELSLPVREHEGALHAFMNGSGQVLVLQGETGSGKTTQVPRILLEAAARDARKKITERSVHAQGPAMQTQGTRQLQEQQHQVTQAHWHQRQNFVKEEQQRQQDTSQTLQETEKECFIICSQPRRLAAISVAARVAAEMNTNVGDVVGYHVRLNAAASASTRLLFCTHGILLRRLLADRTLTDVSVVCLDEVHERSIEVDLLLLVLSKTLVVNPRIKIVLMSASISTETFAAYFNPDAVFARCSRSLQREVVLFSKKAGCLPEEKQVAPRATKNQQNLPLDKTERYSATTSDRSRCGTGAVARLRVPGRTYPVTIFYAEDLRKMLHIPLKEDQKTSSKSSGNGQAIQAQQQARQTTTPGATGDNKWIAAAELSDRVLSPESLMCTSREMPSVVAKLVQYIHLKEPLARRTARHRHAARPAGVDSPQPAAEALPSSGETTGDNKQRQSPSEAEGGAILVFTTGTGEVAAMCRAIEELQLPLWVLPCHASLRLGQQQRVFSGAPPGRRKVVVATNIAETSITIPDISYVIDTGLQKQMHYDVSKRLNQLQEEVISCSSAQQRAGRAGRVGPGECYRLYSREVFDKLMKQTETPEIQRQPLENVCLQLKAIFPEEEIPMLLGQCIEPPAVASVSTAVRRLCRMGALRVDALGKEHLTAFGSVLSLFPMDLLVARMLLYSATLSCVDEVLALCALMAVEGVLYQSYNANPGAKKARLKYFSRSQSDFITNLRVFLAWRHQSVGGNGRAEDSFCSIFGVNPQSMRNAEELRKRFSRVVDEVSLRLLQEEKPKRQVKNGGPAVAPACRNFQSINDGKKTVCHEGVTSLAEDEEKPDEEITQSVVLFEGDFPGAQSDEKQVQDSAHWGLSILEPHKALSGGGNSFRSPSKGPEYEEKITYQICPQMSKRNIGGKEAEAKEAARSKIWHIKACVAAGLYPQVALVRTPKKRFTQVASGTIEKEEQARQVRFLAYLDEGEDVDEFDSHPHRSGDNIASKLQRVFVHPDSVIFQSSAFETQWVAYMEKVQTTKPFIKEISTVSVFALLLLSCCGLRVDGGKGLLCLDDWIQLRCPGLIGTYLRNLKALFYLFLEVSMRETMERVRGLGQTLSQWTDAHSYGTQSSSAPHAGQNRRYLGRGRESIFSGEIGVDLKNDLIGLVKRLVEFEGHRV